MPFFGGNRGGGDYSILTNDNVKGGNNSLALVSGVSNMALGNASLQDITSGSYNIAIGTDAGSYITDQLNSIIIGVNSGNTFVGMDGFNNSRSAVIGNDNNIVPMESIIIGYSIYCDNQAPSQIVIGNDIYTQNGGIAIGNVSEIGGQSGSGTHGYEIVIGHGAINYGTNGAICIGHGSDIWNGASGIAIGMNSAVTGGAESVAIGNSITASNNGIGILRIAGDNQIRIGVNSITDVIIGAYDLSVFKYGSGAPNNSNGVDGNFYFRSDGGAMTTIYQKRSGAWVGIV